METALGVSLPDSSSNVPKSSITSCVPDDVLAAFIWFNDQSEVKSLTQGHTAQLAIMLLEQAQFMGFLSNLDEQTKAWIDALSTLATLFDRPYALLILNAQSRMLANGGHTLTGLEAALVIQTNRNHAPIERRIQHFLNRYTNNKDTVLRHHFSKGSDISVIKDRRLPSWAPLTVGSLDDYYVLAVGDGVFESIIASSRGDKSSLASDKWFSSATTVRNRTEMGWTFYANFDLLEHSVDNKLALKIRDAKRPLGMAAVQRVCLSHGYNKRSVETISVWRRNGRDEQAVVAGSSLLNEAATSSIPKNASRYAVLDGHLTTLYRGIREAYLSLKNPSKRRKKRESWYHFDHLNGVSLERDILPHLNVPIVIHDFPQHAFGIPFAWTITIPIKGSATTLRLQLDKWLVGQQSELAHSHGIQINRDPDDVWYTSFGLAGPALSITDHSLVVSYSPAAVRKNINLLKNSAP